jgi:hypothetical protein
LNSIIQNEINKELKDIAEILLEDMNDYGTLALPTMRRIVDLENKKEKDILMEFKDIIVDLGGIDYLTKIKKKIYDIKKEVIVAIENQ